MCMRARARASVCVCVCMCLSLSLSLSLSLIDNYDRKNVLQKKNMCMNRTSVDLS